MTKECGARARTNGHKPCRQPAMVNGRCRLHGGLSTGPKTIEGKHKARLAVLKHGYYTKAFLEERRLLQKVINESKKNIDKIFRYNF